LTTHESDLYSRDGYAPLSPARSTQNERRREIQHQAQQRSQEQRTPKAAPPALKLKEGDIIKFFKEIRMIDDDPSGRPRYSAV